MTVQSSLICSGTVVLAGEQAWSLRDAQPLPPGKYSFLNDRLL